jgi:hypothetical protein
MYLKAQMNSQQDEAIVSPTQQSEPQLQEDALSLVSVTLPPPPQPQLTNELVAPQTPNGQFKKALNEPKEQLRQASQVHAPENATDVFDTSEALLDELNTANMRISMPSSYREQQQLFRFLYQCVGIGLGAIDERRDSVTLMPLLALPNQPSKLLRGISGQMSEQERAMGLAYAPMQKLVRVYPASFDVVLAQHIGAHLNGKGLQSFLAHYKLRHNQLFLTDIVINDRNIEQTWMLFDGYEHRCRLYS